MAVKQVPPAPGPSARARSMVRSRPSKPASTARPSQAGTPSARAVRFAVPSGTIASGTPVLASASAQARTVPSPPAANTRRAPAATARRANSWLSCAPLAGPNHGSQPRSSAAARQRCRNRRGSRSNVRLTTNATKAMPHCPSPPTPASSPPRVPAGPPPLHQRPRPGPVLRPAAGPVGTGGNTTSTASPPAALVTARSSAPCAAAIALTMASPSPSPPRSAPPSSRRAPLPDPPRPALPGSSRWNGWKSRPT